MLYSICLAEQSDAAMFLTTGVYLNGDMSFEDAVCFY